MTLIEQEDPFMLPSYAWDALRKLGCKNLASFGESRHRLLGLTEVPIRTVFDIGAHKGRRTREYRRKFAAATIYSVEPIPEMCRRLERWAAAQQDRVRVLNLGIGRRAGTTPFYVHRWESIWSTFHIPDTDDPNNYREVSVEVETLDRLAARQPIEDEILIKIDTEGADLEVVEGGTATLSRAAAVIIETLFYPSKFSARAPTFEDIVCRLSELGLVYRGNLSGAWNRGICHGIDAVFMRRDVARQVAA